MGSSDKAPAPIDPAEAIRAQAEANRVDLNSPFGGQRYAQGADGRWSLNTYLSPEMQALADSLIQRAGQAPQQIGAPGMEGLQQGLAERLQGGGGPKPMGGQMMPPPQLGAMLGAMPEGSGVGGLAQLLQGRQSGNFTPPRDPRGG